MRRSNRRLMIENNELCEMINTKKRYAFVSKISQIRRRHETDDHLLLANDDHSNELFRDEIISSIMINQVHCRFTY